MNRNIKPSVPTRNGAPKDFNALIRGSEGTVKISGRKGGIIDNVFNQTTPADPMAKIKAQGLPALDEKSNNTSKVLETENSDVEKEMKPKPRRSFITPTNTDNEEDINDEIYKEENMIMKRSFVEDNESKYSHNVNGVANDMKDFPEFSSLFTNTYSGPMTQNSTTLDIIAVYLKGQKILYIDSKNYCEQKLNYLMMPTIFITAVCSIISMVLKDYDFGATIVSCLAGLSTFILSIISYLKLDAKSEAHKTSAYQFDKAQTMCEFFSGKVLLIKDADVSKKVQDFVSQIEKKVEEIKDVNQFIIPETIRYRYPKIYSVNVFSEIKRYKNREKVLRNELHTIYQKINNLNNNNEPVPLDLIAIKEHKINEILEYQDEYFKLDDQFEEEVNDYVNIQRGKSKWCCSRNKKIVNSHIHKPSVQISIPEVVPSPKSPTVSPVLTQEKNFTSASIQSKLVPPPTPKNPSK